MITLTDINGRTHHVAHEAIARVSEADPSSQWRGIRSIIKFFDGSILECGQEAATVLALVNEEERSEAGRG